MVVQSVFICVIFFFFKIATFLSLLQLLARLLLSAGASGLVRSVPVSFHLKRNVQLKRFILIS